MEWTKRERGSVGGRPRIYKTNAERVAAHRARHKLKAFTVEIPAELYEGLENYLKFRDESKSAVVARLIRTQLLRKR